MTGDMLEKISTNNTYIITGRKMIICSIASDAGRIDVKAQEEAI